MNRLSWLFWTVFSWAVVVPRLLSSGTNIVTETYRLGTLRFWSGADPYALPLRGGDRYEYSPFFCLVYTPFAYCNSKTQALLWALASCAVFWAGLLAWVRWDRSSRWVLYLAALASSIELNISLLYQQINALLVGAVLLAFALYKKERLFAAGLLITGASNLKTIPAIFALPLLLGFRPRFYAGCAVASVFTLAAPALFTGWQHNLFLHQQWFARLFDSLVLVRADQLDIASVLRERGWPVWGVVGQWVVLAGSLAGLSWMALRKRPALTSAYSFVLVTCCLLLISPRSESPTFVFMAPAYLLLANQFLEERAPKGAWVAWGMALFFTSLIYTDLWPKGFARPGGPGFATKTLGTAILWLLAMRGVFRPRLESPDSGVA